MVSREASQPVSHRAAPPLHRACSAKSCTDIRGDTELCPKERFCYYYYLRTLPRLRKVEKAVNRPASSSISPPLSPLMRFLPQRRDASRRQELEEGGRWLTNCSSQSWACLVSHPCYDHLKGVGGEGGCLTRAPFSLGLAPDFPWELHVLPS